VSDSFSYAQTKVISLDDPDKDAMIDLTDSGLSESLHLFGVWGTISLDATSAAELRLHDGSSGDAILNFGVGNRFSLTGTVPFICMLEDDAYIRISEGLNIYVDVTESGVSILNITMTVIYQ